MDNLGNEDQEKSFVVVFHPSDFLEHLEEGRPLA